MAKKTGDKGSGKLRISDGYLNVWGLTLRTVKCIIHLKLVKKVLKYAYT